MFQLNTFHF
ncbi:hypothetical protein Pint_33126 [Pistacia integerrima]|uniref:Uncharacterized protein n=1 Tax=Pistacia integerrima TaxID=434235 RepID=A0ACC0X6A8_9ROSI|nr:hypothetical protein Pint_33126 [Pistacia integerrima]